MAELGPKSAAYRQGLGNVDATANTIGKVGGLGLFTKWGMIVSLVLIVLLIAAIVFLVWKFRDTLLGAAKAVASPLNNTAAAVAAENRTRTNSELDQTEIDRMADDIDGNFMIRTSDARVRSISNNLLSLRYAADWDRLLSAYGRRNCCILHEAGSLPNHITKHFTSDEQLVVRNHLYKIGVKNPGF